MKPAPINPLQARFMRGPKLARQSDSSRVTRTEKPEFGERCWGHGSIKPERIKEQDYYSEI